MNTYYTMFKRESVTYRILTLAVILATVFFACRIIYAGIVSLPYPKELLEASNVDLTNTFLNGRSPYTLASLGWDVPGVNYDYPFLNSLIAAAISTIIRCSAVTAHFIISLTSIVVSGVLGALFVNRYAKTTVGPSLAAILFMFCHWRYGYISAAPDDLGLLGLLITTYIATSDKIRNKPLWCAFAITACFYTKQYFIFAAAGIFIYMLFYSRREAVGFLLYTLVINLIIAVIITLFWPLYWTKAFLFTYVGSLMGGGGQLLTLIDQLEYLVIMFAALFAIIIVSVARFLKKIYSNNAKSRNIKVNENDILSLSAIQSVLMLIPLSVIGRNDGAILTYFLQLWIPYVIIVALVCFEQMIPGSSDPNRAHYLIYCGVYMMICVSTVYLGFGKLPLHILTDQEITDWQKAYEHTRHYSESGEVFYSRGLAYDGFARGNGDWMCGHEGEAELDTEYKLMDMGITPKNYLYVHLIVDQNIKYREYLAQKVIDHKYSLITLETVDNFPTFNEELFIKNGYKCIDRIDLQFGNMPYEVVFYSL